MPPEDHTINMFFKLRNSFDSDLVFSLHKQNTSIHFFHLFMVGSFHFWMPLYFLDNLLNQCSVISESNIPNRILTLFIED